MFLFERAEISNACAKEPLCVFAPERCNLVEGRSNVYSSLEAHRQAQSCVLLLLQLGHTACMPLATGTGGSCPAPPSAGGEAVQGLNASLG